MKKIEIPVWEKMVLTPEEASAYANLGINKIRNMVNEPHCPFALHIGNRKLIKRKAFENYIANRNHI